jgi:hypothetical protein
MRRRTGWITAHIFFLCLTTAASTSAQALLIHDGTVVTSEGSFAADVLVRDGIIVELGTHDELITRDGIYSALWKVQIGAAVAVAQ